MEGHRLPSPWVRHADRALRHEAPRHTPRSRFHSQDLGFWNPKDYSLISISAARGTLRHAADGDGRRKEKRGSKGGQLQPDLLSFMDLRPARHRGTAKRANIGWEHGDRLDEEKAMHGWALVHSDEVMRSPLHEPCGGRRRE
ncbi:unnamed protein product [Musa acuminata var. zebrina]